MTIYASVVSALLIFSIFLNLVSSARLKQAEQGYENMSKMVDQKNQIINAMRSQAEERIRELEKEKRNLLRDSQVAIEEARTSKKDTIEPKPKETMGSLLVRAEENKRRRQPSPRTSSINPLSSSHSTINNHNTYAYDDCDTKPSYSPSPSKSYSSNDDYSSGSGGGSYSSDSGSSGGGGFD